MSTSGNRGMFLDATRAKPDSLQNHMTRLLVDRFQNSKTPFRLQLRTALSIQVLTAVTRATDTKSFKIQNLDFYKP
jgi:hypothetical protein